MRRDETMRNSELRKGTRQEQETGEGGGASMKGGLQLLPVFAASDWKTPKRVTGCCLRSQSGNTTR